MDIKIETRAYKGIGGIVATADNGISFTAVNHCDGTASACLYPTGNIRTTVILIEAIIKVLQSLDCKEFILSCEDSNKYVKPIIKRLERHFAVKTTWQIGDRAEKTIYI